MRPENQRENQPDESMEDDHFFLWEPARGVTKTANEVPKFSAP